MDSDLLWAKRERGGPLIGGGRGVVKERETDIQNYREREREKRKICIKITV